MKKRFKLINDYHFENGSGYIKTLTLGKRRWDEFTLNEFIVPSETEGNAEIDDNSEYITIILEVKNILKNKVEVYPDGNGTGTLDLTYEKDEFFEKFKKIQFSDFLY
jgi:hypothetical protein